jgi:hypothetical protein
MFHELTAGPENYHSGCATITQVAFQAGEYC